MTIRSREQKTCSLCGSAGAVLHRALRDPFYDAPGEWDMRQCSNPACELVWLDPMPLPEDLGRAYESYFTHQDIARTSSPLRRVLRSIYPAVARLSGVTAALQARDRMYLPRRTGDLLEIGFGAGAFLHRMQAEGWNVTGVDFDPQAVERVRSQLGLNVYCGSLRDVAFAERSFDVIAMSHVIEHLPDPRAVLRECFRILRPGGTLVLVTPNTASLGHRWFGPDWYGSDAPRHLYLFNLKNLGALVSQEGFAVERAFSTFANAHIFFGGSLGQRSYARRGLRYAKPSGLHTVAGNILQWIERVYVALQDERRSAGEEAVVIARRPPNGPQP